jgi:hypothetical protein
MCGAAAINKVTNNVKLESTNGSMFKAATIRLSTISLPALYGAGKFETSLFSGKDSEILETYNSLKDAVAGHQKYADDLGLD